MEALERIKEAINNGKTTELNDWLDIARDYNISGNDDVEFIRSIENFVTENFSFETNTEAAYVYFGSDGNANICIEDITGRLKDDVRLDNRPDKENIIYLIEEMDTFWYGGIVCRNGEKHLNLEYKGELYKWKHWNE